MKFKAFIFGLLFSFGLPWLLAIVVPFSQMRSLDPVAMGENDSETFIHKTDGRKTEGSLIYGQEGCYYCHSQLIRPTTVGKDTWRLDWAGLPKNEDHGDTRRETLPSDYDGEAIAHTGVMRIGPDLSNLGRRIGAKENVAHLKAIGLTPEKWLYAHLYNPRGVDGFREGNDDLQENSACPSKKGLFVKTSPLTVRAATLMIKNDDGEEVALVATDRARILVSYLLSLKKDTLGQSVPKSLNFNPTAEAK